MITASSTLSAKPLFFLSQAAPPEKGPRQRTGKRAGLPISFGAKYPVKGFKHPVNGAKHFLFGAKHPMIGTNYSVNGANYLMIGANYFFPEHIQNH